MVDKQLPPDLSVGKPLQAVYVDNFTTVGVLGEDVLTPGRILDQTCVELGFTTHAETALAECLGTVGVRLGIGGKKLLHKPIRVWRFYPPPSTSSDADTCNMIGS